MQPVLIPIWSKKDLWPNLNHLRPKNDDAQSPECAEMTGTHYLMLLMDRKEHTDRKKGFKPLLILYVCPRTKK